MKITRVEARTVRIPLARPVFFSTRAVTHREFALARVHTDDGLEGLGYSLGGHIVAVAVRDLLTPVILGDDAHAPERLWERMWRHALLPGRRGAVVRAMSAVDIALWDIIGQAAGQPVARLLGGYRDRVRAYGSGGYYWEGKTADDLASEVGAWKQAGLEAGKIKVGAIPLSEDIERVRICREALGPHFRLMLDANNAWPDAATAIHAARAFEPYDIYWIEEPVTPDNLYASREVARVLEMRVATGEIEATRWGFREIVEQRAADVLQPDATVCGGITEWMKIAHLAQAFDLPVEPHAYAELHVHLVAAVPHATYVEYFPDDRIMNIMRLFREPLRLREGWLEVPPRPGLGVELDAAAVDQYAVEPWG